MRYEIDIHREAYKILMTLPKAIRESIRIAIRKLANNPRPKGCKKLIGKENQYRIRVREYRIIYLVNDNQLKVLVIRIGPRKDVY